MASDRPHPPDAFPDPLADWDRDRLWNLDPADDRDDYDSPWKSIIDRYFPEFIEFFLPEASDPIDWSREPVFLDTELRQIIRDAELGRRLADRLVQVWLKNGQETWVLIHIEVQRSRQPDFAQRIYTYHYRIYDTYQRPVSSLVLLADDHPQWRPDHFGYSLFGTALHFSYPTIKLLDWASEIPALEAHRNPFATVVLTHLTAVATRTDPATRLQEKLKLVKALYRKGYDRQDILELFHFIDWLLKMPKLLEQRFWQEIQTYEEAQKMPYITSVERLAIEQGIEQGRQLGEQVTYLKILELELELKWGERGRSLLVALAEMSHGEDLYAILRALKTVETPAELLRWWVDRSLALEPEPEVFTRLQQGLILAQQLRRLVEEALGSEGSILVPADLGPLTSIEALRDRYRQLIDRA